MEEGEGAGKGEFRFLFFPDICRKQSESAPFASVWLRKIPLLQTIALNI
jgi:hypothetical protein